MNLKLFEMLLLLALGAIGLVGLIGWGLVAWLRQPRVHSESDAEWRARWDAIRSGPPQPGAADEDIVGDHVELPRGFQR